MLSQVRGAVCPGLLVLVLGCSVVAQLKNGYHEDTKYGFKIKVPDKWTTVPVDIDEKWIVAKYLCNRSYQSKGGQYYADHRPYLRVIVFTDSARKYKGPKVSRQGDTTTIQAANIPYKDYQDYLKRNLNTGGFFFEKEKATKSGDVACMEYEVKIEKSAGAPRRLIASVFEGDEADYAVEFEVLEDHYKKLQPLCVRALRTFEFIPREAALSGGTTGTSPNVERDTKTIGLSYTWGETERTSWRKKPAAERKKLRKQHEDARIAKMTKDLPDGWSVKKSKNFVVLTHADPKYTQKVLEAAEACRSWLTKELDSVSDEYALKGVLRICADGNEARLYSQGSGDSWDPEKQDREIVLSKDFTMRGSRSEFETLFRYLVAQFMWDKDPLLWRYCPAWLEHGLYQYVGTAKPKGNGLDFDADPWENDAIRNGRRDSKIKTVREILEMTDKDFTGSYQLNASMASRLVRYLEGDGRRQSFLKNFMVEYMKATIVEGETLFGKDRVRTTATTEEEEEKRYRDQKQQSTKEQMELIKALHAKICKWSDRDWESFERGYSVLVN